MSHHTCHAHGCTASVPPRLFMCRLHWAQVKPVLQKLIWRYYRAGQEIDKKPSLMYLAVQQRAVAEVAFRPHDEEAARIAAQYIIKSEVLRRECLDRRLGDPLHLVDNSPLFPPGSKAAAEVERATQEMDAKDDAAQMDEEARKAGQ